MSISTKNKHNHLLMFILTLEVFGILNTENGHGARLVRVRDFQPRFGLHDELYRTVDNPCDSGILSSALCIHRFLNRSLFR